MSQPGPISRVSSAPPAGGLTGLAPLLAVTPSYLVAEWLIQHTHHRPLGAVAFATTALVLFVGCESFVRLALTDDARLASLVAPERRVPWRSWLRRGAWAVATLGVAGVGFRALG